jgi:hypothetical protein
VSLITQVVEQQPIPALEFDQVKRAPQHGPQAFSRFFPPTLLIKLVSKLQHLVRQKCQQIQKVKDNRQGLLAVPVVVLQFIALILMHIELLVVSRPGVQSLRPTHHLSHWILDVVFREDDSRVRVGNAPENLAPVRKLTHNLLQQETTLKRGIQTKRLKAGWDRSYLLKILVIAHRFSETLLLSAPHR